MFNRESIYKINKQIQNQLPEFCPSDRAYLISSFLISDALNNLADGVKNIRTDHPLQGETFECITQALEHIADALETKR